MGFSGENIEKRKKACSWVKYLEVTDSLLAAAILEVPYLVMISETQVQVDARSKSGA